MVYSIELTGNAEREVVTEAHFGLNLVTIYDQEFISDNRELSSNVIEINASTLRFPGGSVSEYYFDIANPNASVSSYGVGADLTPMDDFFTKAGQIDVSVSLVIPTRQAFTLSAAEAMLLGEYGSRTQLSENYLSGVIHYVSTAISHASANGVNITAFEIGNEFWGSGEMTASEYGVVAGNVAVLLDDLRKETMSFAPEIVVQSTSSASNLFSPRNPTTGYVGMVDGELSALSDREYIANYNGATSEDWTMVTIPAAGTAIEQVEAIADQINSIYGASEKIDGLSQHYYESSGFESVDQNKKFKFAQFDRLQLLLTEGSKELSHHITEWNTNTYGLNARGLQNASMMVEIFYEMVSNDIDVAQIWPLSFNNAQGISLVDLDGHGLSISGEMFRLMSESLIGLSSSVDWSFAESLDIHGFSNTERIVLFASERSGLDTSDITIKLEHLVPGSHYFVATTELWDGAAGGRDSTANPVLGYKNGYMVDSPVLEFGINSWAIQRLEITKVGNSSDIVTGRHGNDYIDGLAGNDTLNGGKGDDSLIGGGGDDILFGGDGSDEIYGGDGVDTAILTGDEFELSLEVDDFDSEFLLISNRSGDVDKISSVEFLQVGAMTANVERVEAYRDYISDLGIDLVSISIADFFVTPVACLPTEILFVDDLGF